MDIDAVNRACLGYARRVCPRDPALDAQDILQSAWLRAFAHLAALPDDEARRKYLNVAIRTVAIDHQRRMARRPIPVQLFDQHIGGDAEEEAIALAELATVLPTVPPALILYALGYEWGEIAALLGVPLITTKTRAHRWRRAQEELQA
jgi:DNA-directed RNA polymerase specialized sigma24 family protein